MSKKEMNIEEIDNKLLNLLQSNFPLTTSPYKDLGDLLSITEEEVIERTQKLKEVQYIRQISAIFDTRSMKYKSTLVAMAFDEEKLDTAAHVINSHPGVTHNYKRNHFFNLWFTLAVPPDSKLGLEQTVDLLSNLSHSKSTRILPTLKLFKIGVKLDMTGEDSLSSKDENFYGEQNISTDYVFNEKDINIIKEVQEDLPLTPNPFKEIGLKLNISAEEVIDNLKIFNKAGIMRRVAAILHHRKAGFRANAMGVWKVPEDMIESIAPKMASFKSVSHCYRRPTYPDWPYSLFTMIHGRSAKDCNSLIKKLSDITGIKEYDALYSSKEYKKTRLKYFSDEYKTWENQYGREEDVISINN
tara:strand:- start:7523 stop:8593 length:1071 start_codon:yes stop_codon:yes gene_type:complete